MAIRGYNSGILNKNWYFCSMTHQIISVAPDNIRKYATEFSSFGSDYVFSRIDESIQLADFASQALRLGGLTMVMCVKGDADISINLEKYHLEDNTLIIVGPDSVLSVDKVDYTRVDAYVFVMSQDFIRDVNFDTNMLASMNITRDQPLLKLSADEVSLLGRYFDLIHYNTVENSEAQYVRSIARSLIAAIVYQLMQFVSKRALNEAASPALSRRANYVREFIQLVNQYHRRERGVAFYASKLFISPKYLSLIIKEGTGRSAAEWIDAYVILEAKNLLRFSGKNVQQIAYELNFSNQSSFGKYFKHLTGMSPTKFQRS